MLFCEMLWEGVPVFVRRFDRTGFHPAFTTKDVDGNSILHNSMIVYGSGSGNADSNRHTHDNLPVVLAGSGGGLLTPQRNMQHGGQPMSNLFLSLADRMGVQDLDRFGDSTGRLANV